MTAIDTRGIEIFQQADVSEDLVRVMVLSGPDRRLLLMWDMTREQAATFTAVIDGRLDDYHRMESMHVFDRGGPRDERGEAP